MTRATDRGSSTVGALPAYDSEIGVICGRVPVWIARKQESGNVRYSASVDGQQHFKRLRCRELPGGVRFVTCSCEQRLPLLRNAKIADVFVASLLRAKAKFRFRLHAWVVMPEHVHLLLTPSGDESLERAMSSLKQAVAQRVIARWRQMDAPILDRIRDAEFAPRFWLKGGGFDRNVRNDRELEREIQYIHRNPVERGLVVQPEQWRWSSVHWWKGQRDDVIECEYPSGPGWEEWGGYM